jgi:hypothetical protein
MRLGKEENYPYSLSRWTDVPGGKWPWFLQKLREGSFLGFDPCTGMPDRWSLSPEDVLGLIFWTKDPRNLLKDREILRPFKTVIHFTITGWSEVELRVPSLESSLALLPPLIESYGLGSVTIRYSPIPQQKSALDRWPKIAEGLVSVGVREVYLSSLRYGLSVTDLGVPLFEAISYLSKVAGPLGLKLLGCADDEALDLPVGVCESGDRFLPNLKRDSCGCAKVVDPFTRSESCSFGCKYCYASRPSARRNIIKG